MIHEQEKRYFVVQFEDGREVTIDMQTGQNIIDGKYIEERIVEIAPFDVEAR